MLIEVNSSQDKKSEFFFLKNIQYRYMFNLAVVFEKFIGNLDLKYTMTS